MSRTPMIPNCPLEKVFVMSAGRWGPPKSYAGIINIFFKHLFMEKRKWEWKKKDDKKSDAHARHLNSKRSPQLQRRHWRTTQSITITITPPTTNNCTCSSSRICQNFCKENSRTKKKYGLGDNWFWSQRLLCLGALTIILRALRPRWRQVVGTELETRRLKINSCLWFAFCKRRRDVRIKTIFGERGRR